MGSLQKYIHIHKPRGPVPYPHAKFQLDTSKHDETYSRTYRQTDKLYRYKYIIYFVHKYCALYIQSIVYLSLK